MTGSVQRVAPSTGAYGLAEPTLTDVRTALEAIFGPDRGAELYQDSLRTAGLTGTEHGEPALTRMIDGMRRGEPVVALCAQSMAIRLDSFTRLSAAHQMLRSTP